MKAERLFSRSGLYGFLLDTNVLLHRQAAENLTNVAGELISASAPQSPVTLLDLACGGWPSTVAAMINAIPEVEFHYTGIDINPDQVAQASRDFRFPANTTRIRIIEGNAWDLEPILKNDRFRLIYSGMNLHHGTPEEIWFLARQLRVFLDNGGLFVSHDVYRPDQTPYRRRPDVNPERPEESLRLVAPERLASASTPALTLVEDRNDEDPPWRLDYLARMHETLLARGGDRAGADSTIEHMRQHDYPISLNEFQELFGQHGFVVEFRRYREPSEPMSPYVGMGIVRRPRPRSAL